MIEARTPRRWRARLAVVTVVAGLFTTGVVATAPAGRFATTTPLVFEAPKNVPRTSGMIVESTVRSVD